MFFRGVKIFVVFKGTQITSKISIGLATCPTSYYSLVRHYPTMMLSFLIGTANGLNLLLVSRTEGKTPQGSGFSRAWSSVINGDFIHENFYPQIFLYHEILSKPRIYFTTKISTLMVPHVQQWSILEVTLPNHFKILHGANSNAMGPIHI